MSNLTDRQFYGITIILGLLAAPYIAVLSFLVW
jgi:hypothetical protein